MLKRLSARFAPAPLATLATATAVLVFVALGQWQLGRAEEKRALADDFARAGPATELRRLPEDAPRYQRVTARGRYQSDRQFLLDNRVHGGHPGVHVLTPLVLNDGSAVLVNRGWRPFGPDRSELPDVAVDAAPRSVAGRADMLVRVPIDLEAKAGGGWPKLVHYPRMEELALLLGRDLHPRTILLDPWEPDGYVREWAPPGAPAARNLAYAVQWFAFGLVAIAIWVVHGLRRRERAR